MTNIETFQRVERDFVRVAARAGLPEPDEVHYDEEAEEMEFIWHDQKLAVVVELDEYSASCVASDDDNVPF